jgi:hypothetical protein
LYGYPFLCFSFLLHNTPIISLTPPFNGDSNPTEQPSTPSPGPAVQNSPGLTSPTRASTSRQHCTIPKSTPARASRRHQRSTLRKRLWRPGVASVGGLCGCRCLRSMRRL